MFAAALSMFLLAATCIVTAHIGDTRAGRSTDNGRQRPVVPGVKAKPSGSAADLRDEEKAQ